MIGTALFLLYATAIAHADVDDTEIDGFYDNGCPKDTSLEKSLPHEDCEQFYQCFHGALISRFCPNGLHFNADLEKCDWLGNADCHNKRDEDNDSTFEELDKNNPNHATLICSSPDSNNVLVAHKNCNQFFKCSYGRALVLNCAENLLYNIANEKCDFAHNVNCGERLRLVNDSQTIEATTNKDIGFSYSIEEIDQSNSDPSQAIVQCSAKRSDGVLVAHEYCNKFYKCSGGVPVTVKCPSALFYDPIKEYCDWPANVDCDGRTIPEIDDGSNTRSVEKNIDTADSPMNENSGDDDDNSAAAICAANNSDGLLIAHEMCNHFYKCKGSKPVAFRCPGDLLFNSKQKYCDWPHNIECGERIEPEISASEKKRQAGDPSQVHTICSAEGSDGVLVAHESCNKFYKCHDGRPVEVKCPDILLYNLKKENCDWPTHVNCNDRTVPDNGWSLIEGDENNIDSASENGDENNVDSSLKNSKKKKGKSKHRHHSKVRSGTRNKKQNADLSHPAKTCADERFDGKILPHENCNQFYKCFEGKAVALFCPLNLFYNIHKEYCDWPYNVKCSNRVVPGNYSNGQEDGITNSSCQGEVEGTICSSTREVQSVL